MTKLRRGGTPASKRVHARWTPVAQDDVLGVSEDDLEVLGTPEEQTYGEANQV